MTALASHKIQEAAFVLLKDDATLGLKLSGVYDQPPEAAVWPYLSMGETSITAADLKDRRGNRLDFEITVWSNQQSQMEVKELMADVDRVLSGVSIQAVGLDTLPVRLLNANVVRQYSQTGSLYRGRLSYSVKYFDVI